MQWSTKVGHEKGERIVAAILPVDTWQDVHCTYCNFLVIIDTEW